MKIDRRYIFAGDGTIPEAALSFNSEEAPVIIQETSESGDSIWLSRDNAIALARAILFETKESYTNFDHAIFEVARPSLAAVDVQAT